jgi:hypothetical protein
MRIWAAGALALLVLTAPARGQGPVRFDHRVHQRVFPACEGCHRGAADPEQAMWPDSSACTACHDGAARPRVSWRPRREATPTNLKFAHELLPMMTRATPSGPQTLGCRDCHIAPGQPWMTVSRAAPERCLECHKPGTPHLAVDSPCETCHVPLPRATRLAAADVASFPVPPSHRQPGFLTRAGHGTLARGTDAAVAVSCTVCHARDFCTTCHVDAPENAAIQALAPDARSTAIAVKLEPPPSHRAATFLREHGAAVRANPGQCATCHAQESCLACHAPSQRVAVALPARSPDRAVGAQPVRRPPDSHRENFTARHPREAAAAAATCAGCHVQTDCFACHRPSTASGPGYHPTGFIERHPAAAYARETSCAECHSVGAFCQACHAKAGLVSTKRLGSGYHDASRFFLGGHGKAARQGLETCVGCHVERDCLACHSAAGGRRFSPHGPGFDGSRLKRKNPEVCTACHGTAIPGG